jgi:hypothetical protein
VVVIVAAAALTPHLGAVAAFNYNAAGFNGGGCIDVATFPSSSSPVDVETSSSLLVGGLNPSVLVGPLCFPPALLWSRTVT